MMQASGGGCPIARVNGEVKADGPVGLKVSCIFTDVVEDVSWTLVDGKDGCFEVDGGPKVVVVGQLVWIDEDVGWERIKSMERTGRGERGKGETRDEGGVEARWRLQVTHPYMFPTAIRRWSTTATKPAKFGQPVFASHPHLGPSISLPSPEYSDSFSQSKEMNSHPAFLPASTSPGVRNSSNPSRTTPSSSSWVARSNT